jgi:hypothetical protein
LGVLALLTGPFLLWKLKPEKQLEMLIIDKTVPDETYREHNGLVWLLNHEKYTKKNGKAYERSIDYEGVKPAGSGTYRADDVVKSLQKRHDVIYLADTYGIYEADVENETDGRRSEQLYGGLSAEEADAVSTSLLKHGGTFIAEFNSFASPTDEEVRTKMYDLLNLTWTGWIGRAFVDLQNNEVPVWVKDRYQEQYKDKWPFQGGGLVFVNEQDEIVVIPDKEIEQEVTVKLTKQGKEQWKQANDAPYRYWFDVVKANDKSEILARYELQVKAEAGQLLENYGIPTDFPAIVRHQNNQFETYYFAGDYADQAELPSIYQTVGFTSLKKLRLSSEKREDHFYWNMYVPVMKNILENPYKPPAPAAIETVSQDGMTIHGKAGKDYLQVYQNGKWEDLLIEGINMGIAKPGHFPGETAITKTEYLRWFQKIGEMNANAIRVYTLHPPHFYEALYEYNQIASRPLYLFHGVWVTEETLVKTEDAFSEEVMEDFRSEMKRIVDVVHGNADIPEVPGHASGIYKADISKYVLGWVIGIEWDPAVVLETNKKHAQIGQYSGRYMYTKEANPFEHWLALHMDELAVYEADQYKWQRPVSFVNWPTTDLMNHPNEPLENEDMVSIDPNRIYAADEFYPGVFASYHFYPYYPDFLNYEPKYVNHKDQEGKKNNYAGYLQDMKKLHRMPLLVAEFGVPASRGLTHKNVHGMNQGMHSEQQQGELNSKLFRSIVAEGMAGGLVFTWQDEWFKRTWNTMEYDNPDRRPFWSNMQTNEQHFGILSFDPGKFESPVYVDGRSFDWEKLKQKDTYKPIGTAGDLKQFEVTSDAAYLYMKLNYSGPIDADELKTDIVLNTIPNQGQSSLPDGGAFKTDPEIDFVIQLRGREDSRVVIDSYYDSFYYHYGHVLKLIDQQSYASVKNNGNYHPIRLALNKGFTLPDGRNIPFEQYEAGKLLAGNGNPKLPQFDSLADLNINEEEGFIELRLPWLLLNVKDPSLHEIMGDMWKGGISSTVTAKDFQAAVIHYETAESGSLAVKETMPAADSGYLPAAQMYRYEWKEWEEPVYHERLKESYYILQQTYEETRLKESH